MKSNAKITLAVRENALLAPYGARGRVCAHLYDGFYAVFAMHLFEAIAARDASGRDRLSCLRTLKHSLEAPVREVPAPRRLALLWPVDVGPHLEVDLAICFEADDAEQGTVIINTDISQFT